MSQNVRIVNLKKYSNSLLFEKRKKNFEMKKRELLYSKKKNNSKIKSAFLSKKETKNSFCNILPRTSASLIPDLTSQSVPDIKCLENSLIKINNINSLKKEKNEENKNELKISQIKDDVFLTEASMIDSYRKASAFNLFRNNKTLDKNKDYNTLLRKLKPNSFHNRIESSKSIVYRNYSNDNNADILLYFQYRKKLMEEKDEFQKKNYTQKEKQPKKTILKKINNDSKAMIKEKIKKINLKEKDLSYEVIKIKQFQLQKYASNMLNENYKRLKENYQSDIDYYNFL